jgi:hypothetical protein
VDTTILALGALGGLALGVAEILRRLNRMEARIVANTGVLTEHIRGVRSAQAHAVEEQTRQLTDIETAVAGATTDLRLAAQMIEPVGD